MKVYFVIPSMAGGGAERVISILSNYFVNKGIQVSILMTASNAVEYHLDQRIELIQVGVVTGSNVLGKFSRIKAMRGIFSKKENREAIIIPFGPETSFYTALADLGLKHKLIISERNNPQAYPHPLLRDTAYKRASKLVFQTQQAKDLFKPSIRNKGVVIPNPISNNMPEPFQGERDKRIVAVGRLEKQKNYPLLIDAFSAFWPMHQEYTLHIYGKGILLQDLQRQVAACGLEKAVFFEGFCPNIAEKISSAGMYILSSDFEGISNALLEAMALGLPVISTDCPSGGSAMCIINNKNGILTPVGDRSALTNAMTFLADHPVKAEELGNEACKVRVTYKEETIAEKWLKEIESLM